MKIKWMGHSCFLITAQDGRTLLTDPFDATVGYTLPGVPANIVTCSHNHFDHHAVELLPNGYTVIDDVGIHHSQGFVVDGIMSYHDDKQGSLRGANIIYRVEIDGLVLVHMGDIGHPVSQSVLEMLGDVDVLMIPVGGVFTINADTAAEEVNRIKPKLTIPMHFQTKHLNFQLDDEKAFLRHFEHEYIGVNEIELTRDNIASFPPVIVMAYEERTQG
ncbi:MAG: MBL fold metallo-hydrolase [Clostridia bacterium]|nr:MBL fold metallo-hydrolase [Clostridia bacterium]